MLARISALSLLLALAVVGGPQQTRTNSEKASPGRPGPVAVLSYVTSLGIVFVPGEVEGHPASLLFDTGGKGSLNSRWLRASHLEARGGYQASGAGPAMVQASLLPDARWKLGAAQVKSNGVVMDLTSLESILGRRIDGIVGTEFLSHYIVELDPGSQQFRVYDPGVFQPMSGAVSIPLDFDNNGYAGVHASVEFGDKLASGVFMIDSGSDGSIDLYHSFARQNGLPLHPAEIDELSTGIGGNQHNRLERASAFRIGSFDLRGPVVAFNDSDDSFGARTYAGLIGMEILQRFIVAFDFPHKQMYLSPLPAVVDPFNYDCSGLRLHADGPDFHHVEIVRVIRGSAADLAGALPGDTLLRVDGEDAAVLGLEQIRKKCRRPGTLDVELLRRGKRVTARLSLKPLI